MTVSRRTLLELFVFVALAGSALLRSWQLDRARHALGAAALEADTLRATLDRTRILVGIVDAGKQAAQRQVVQVKAEKDDTDRRLGLERIARTQLEIQVERLAAVVEGSPVTETPEGVRTTKFVVDSAPFYVEATATVPRPPLTGRLSLSITLDPIVIDARHGCSAPNEAGIRSAYLTVIGPTWATVNLNRVEQDPGLCRSPALEPVHNDGRPWWRKAIDRVGVSVGLGSTAGVDLTGRTAVVFGPSVVAGVKVWP